MSVLNGTVKKVGSKTWDDGNTSYSILVMDDAGGEAWYTNYAYDKAGQPPIDTRITAELRTSKNGKDYISDFVVDGGQAPTQPKSQPHTNRPAEANSSTPDADTWRKKDLNIATQAIFKTIYPGQDELNVQDALALAFKGACFIEKKINAYVAGADIEGLKRNLADDVQAAVEQDNHADNTEVAGPEHTSQPDDPGFDDDIPF